MENYTTEEQYGVINEEKEVLQVENNGWIKILSEKDLPKEENDYWVINNYGECFICVFDVDYKAFKGYFHYDNNGKVTHYQPIIKPQPPKL